MNYLLYAVFTTVHDKTMFNWDCCLAIAIQDNISSNFWDKILHLCLLGIFVLHLRRTTSKSCLLVKVNFVNIEYVSVCTSYDMEGGEVVIVNC